MPWWHIPTIKKKNHFKHGESSENPPPYLCKGSQRFYFPVK